jgi:hypothetical protein
MERAMGLDDDFFGLREEDTDDNDIQSCDSDSDNESGDEFPPGRNICSKYLEKMFQISKAEESCWEILTGTSSVESERIFSKLTEIYRAKRSMLSSENAM